MVNRSALSTALKAMTMTPAQSYFSAIAPGLPGNQGGPPALPRGAVETVLSTGGPSIRGNAIMQFSRQGWIGVVHGL